MNSMYVEIETKELWEIVNRALFAAEKNHNQETARGRAYIKLADAAHTLYSMQRCEEMNKQTHEEIALGLWRAWFKWSGEPYETLGNEHTLYCFFCGEKKGHPHLDGCPYIEAAKLLGEECT